MHHNACVADPFTKFHNARPRDAHEPPHYLGSQASLLDHRRGCTQSAKLVYVQHGPLYRQQISEYKRHSCGDRRANGTWQVPRPQGHCPLRR